MKLSQNKILEIKEKQIASYIHKLKLKTHKF
jgi:hypothetical protein